MMRNVKIAEKKMARIEENLKGKSVKIPTLCRRLNKEFKNTKVRFKMRKVKEYSFCAVEGEFNCYADVEIGDGRYSVMFSYKPGYSTIPKKAVRGYIKEITCILVHEFRHGYQHNRRKGKYIDPERQTPKFSYSNKHVQKQVLYYTNYDELDANAYEMAYARSRGWNWNWRLNRYRKYLGRHFPKLYNKFLKKSYKYYMELT